MKYKVLLDFREAGFLAFQCFLFFIQLLLCCYFFVVLFLLSFSLLLVLLTGVCHHWWLVYESICVCVGISFIWAMLQTNNFFISSSLHQRYGTGRHGLLFTEKWWNLSYYPVSYYIKASCWIQWINVYYLLSQGSWIHQEKKSSEYRYTKWLLVWMIREKLYRFRWNFLVFLSSSHSIDLISSSWESKWDTSERLITAISEPIMAAMSPLICNVCWKGKSLSWMIDKFHCKRQPFDCLRGINNKFRYQSIGSYFMRNVVDLSQKKKRFPIQSDFSHEQGRLFCGKNRPAKYPFSVSASTPLEPLAQLNAPIQIHNL